MQGDEGVDGDGGSDVDDDAADDGKSEDELPDAEVDELACQYGCLAPGSRYTYGRLDEWDQEHLEKVRGARRGKWYFVAMPAPRALTTGWWWCRKLLPRVGCSSGGRLGGDGFVSKRSATRKRLTSFAG